jgi:hypothetical protein
MGGRLDGVADSMVDYVNARKTLLGQLQNDFVVYILLVGARSFQFEGKRRILISALSLPPSSKAGARV